MPASDVYNTIVVTSDPKGRFVDCVVDGTPKPGTIMQLKAGTAKNGLGLFTYEAYNRDADGNRPQGAIAILREKNIIGQGVNSAYVAGEIGHLYFPLPGDELLAILADVAGTGDPHTVGEILMVDDGTGKLIATTGTPETEPFVLLESFAALTADVLAHVQFSGF